MSVRVKLYEEMLLMRTMHTVQVINTTNLKSVMKNQDIKKALFPKFRQYSYLSVFGERQKCLNL